MYKLYSFIAIFVLFIVACGQNNNPDKTENKDTVNKVSCKGETIKDSFDIYKIIDARISEEEAKAHNIVLKPEGNYNELKRSIKEKQADFAKKYTNSANKDSIIKEARKYFEETLINKVFSHWYGMEWNFSGYSDIPQKGEVGCSYFVSNTLLHMGLNINRYKFGQAHALSIAKSFQPDKKVIQIRGKEQSEIVEFIKKKLKEGLYIVGLDNHVGFILFRKGDVFFIQSSYIDPIQVVVEKAEIAPALTSSLYVIGELSTNDSLIVKWITKERINVIK